MDPNENLKNQEELIQELSEYEDDRDHPAAINARADLNTHRAALAKWLRHGGFQPNWAQYPRAARYYGKEGKG